MPWEVIHFFVNAVEAIAAMAGVLVAGLLITLTGLWILPKIFGVKPETLEDSELDEERISDPGRSRP